MTGSPCVILNVKRGIGSTLMKAVVIISPVIVGRGTHGLIDLVHCPSIKRIALPPMTP